jgi:hypothetical protein
MLDALHTVLGRVCEMPTAVIEARTQEEEELVNMVVRHLVAFYWSTNPSSR